MNAMQARRALDWSARLTLFVATALLAGCSWFNFDWFSSKDASDKWDADRLYSEARLELNNGSWTKARELYQKLESRFPFGRHAQQALMEIAYCYYKEGESAQAIQTADRFIRQYPNHPSVDYAYYLKGLVHFREDQGLLGYLYETDLSERDPKAMKESFVAFKELSQKFPESRYAEDAHSRMRYLSNALGLYEVHVARYYFNRGAYLAAANRAQASLLAYPAVPANEDALDLLVRSYEKLGMTQLAEDSRRILAKTYPESRYLTAAQAKPWWRFW